MEWYISMLIGAVIGGIATGFYYNNVHSTKVKALEDRLTAAEDAIKKVVKP